MNGYQPLGVTMGDPGGIGPEIIVKSLASANLAGELADIIVIGDYASLRRTIADLGLDVPLRTITPKELDSFESNGKSLNVLAIDSRCHNFPPGELSPVAGDACYRYICTAINLAIQGKITGIVTAPINKEALSLAGIKHLGHTEILAEFSATKDFIMVLVNNELRVALTTIHVPLRQACDLITLDRVFTTIKLSNRACLELGIIQPRIAVAGLNPHAGENGLLGREDLEIIAPAIAKARAQGINALGPFSADTVFTRARGGEFDMVVAQTHDQGLIPIKYLGVANGVNITVGLPFVRTSPDHGTAFDIAGKGIANPGGMLAAISYAKKLIENRQM